MNLKLIAKAAMQRLHAIHEEAAASIPPLFSGGFIELVRWAIEAGRLSLRRAAALLGVSVEQLAELCRDYGMPLSYGSPAQV